MTRQRVGAPGQHLRRRRKFPKRARKQRDLEGGMPARHVVPVQQGDAGIEQERKGQLKIITYFRVVMD